MKVEYDLVQATTSSADEALQRIGRAIVWRFMMASVAYGVVLLVCFVESMYCETAWGGPFTILISITLKFVFAGLAVAVALVAGLLLLIPGVRDLWRRAGYCSLLLSVVAIEVMIFASNLGLRTVDPVSNYRMMPFGIWALCLVAIAFPIVNLPVRRKGGT